MRVLLIEDHDKFAAFIKQGLESAGFAVDRMGTAAEGEAAAASISYDAMVLDLGLPDDDGMNLLGRLRQRGDSTPVLILTARDGLGDRVDGLNAGADDYLLKPAAMEELVARLRALLRRPGGVLGLTLTAGNVAFDTTAREVRINGSSVAVSRREMELLEQLMRRKGRVVPKAIIEEKMYGFGEEVTSNSVEVHVSRLRKRLAKAGATLHIHTLRGVGYLISDEAR